MTNSKKVEKIEIPKREITKEALEKVNLQLEEEMMLRKEYTKSLAEDKKTIELVDERVECLKEVIAEYGDDNMALKHVDGNGVPIGQAYFKKLLQLEQVAAFRNKEQFELKKKQFGVTDADIEGFLGKVYK